MKRWIVWVIGLTLSLGLFVPLFIVAVPFLLGYGAGVEVAPSDVVVSLARTSKRDRYAALLVEQGLAPQALSTLVDPHCLRTGQPRKACASGVRSTVDEALFLRRIFETDGVRNAIIVTSNFHVPRAATIFHIVFFGSGIKIQMAAPPDVPPSRRAILSELRKFVPSVGGAIVGRAAPGVYEWVVARIGDGP